MSYSLYIAKLHVWAWRVLWILPFQDQSMYIRTRAAHALSKSACPPRTLISTISNVKVCDSTHQRFCHSLEWLLPAHGHISAKLILSSQKDASAWVWTLDLEQKINARFCFHWRIARKPTQPPRLGPLLTDFLKLVIKILPVFIILHMNNCKLPCLIFTHKNDYQLDY